MHLIDKPSPLFGEALRQQVEERLNFFETGAPPSKNADAIRKVLEKMDLNDDEDEDMDAEPALPLIEPSPKKDKKKRKHRGDDDAMDVDEEEETPVKKRKLSKEEKKALKKEKKKEAKEKAAAEVSLTNVITFRNVILNVVLGRGRGATEGEKGKER